MKCGLTKIFLMSKIDFVVISSDDNPLYKDFYSIVAKQWYKLGYKTYYVNITNENSFIENEYGIVHKIKSLESVSTGFQSQVVRLFVSNLVNDKNLLMSDIDMLPINKDYFENIAEELQPDKIILYSGQPYGDVPYYPMCYVLGNSNLLKHKLGIENMSFDEYCSFLCQFYGIKWNTDEHFMYDKLNKYSENLIIKRNRNFKNRIDRGSWFYDSKKLEKNYYIDSHLLRPYSEYQSQINKLLKEINQ